MSALQKIASDMTRIPQRDLRQVEGMNAFFIIPTNVKRAIGELFMTHPPLEKRLARLAAIAQEMGRPVAGRLAGPRMGLATSSSAEEPQGREARQALRALDGPGHARGRARAEARRRRRDRLQAALGGRVRARGAGDRRAAGRRRADLRLRGAAPLRTPTATSGSSCATATSRISSPASTWSRASSCPRLRRAAARGDLRLRGRRAPRTYLIYGFKRGAFWPFVPTGEDQERDNAAGAAEERAQGELPIEPDLARWLGLFDAPLD